MIGTIVNTLAICAGSITGSVLRKGIGEKYQKVLFDAMGLAALGIGINSVVRNMPESKYPVLFIVSLALGIVTGTKLDLDGRFNRFTARHSSGRLAEGLTTGILLYCIGTLSILGPIQSALNGDNTFLFTNATLDLVTSAVLASTYGIGMIFAAPVLFCWQGAIYLAAGALSGVLTGGMLTEISIVGGFLIMSSGLSILKVKEFRTLNMLPSLLIPFAWFAVRALYQMLAG